MQISPKVEIITKNAIETKKLGALLAKTIIVGSPISNKQALIISLEGDLGSGKTTFAQGFADGLGTKEKIQSPTYVILKIYNLSQEIRFLRRCRVPASSGIKTRSKTNFLRQADHQRLIHVDAYRVGPKDFATLGWKEFVRDSKNIILVEWGNKIKKILPKNTIRIIFTHQKGDERRIKVFQ